MHSVTQDRQLVVGGVDSHADTRHVTGLDERGALLATKSFATTTPGYRQALEWLARFGKMTRSVSNPPAHMPRDCCATFPSTTSVWSRSTSPTPHAPAWSARATPLIPRWPHGCSLPGKANVTPKQAGRTIEATRTRRVAAAAPSKPVPCHDPDPGCDHHRSAAAARPTRRLQDASRQGNSLRSLPALRSRPHPPPLSREVRGQVPRSALRVHRPRDREP
jgi:hypothetical protein